MGRPKKLRHIYLFDHKQSDPYRAMGLNRRKMRKLLKGSLILIIKHRGAPAPSLIVQYVMNLRGCNELERVYMALALGSMVGHVSAIRNLGGTVIMGFPKDKGEGDGSKTE